VRSVIEFIFTVFFFVLIWYFLRSLAKAISNMARIQENHEEFIDLIDDLKMEVKELRLALDKDKPQNK
jgi:uncharacterized protein YqhQ